MSKSIHISEMTPVIEELVNNGKEVEISPQGVSMKPSIVTGDTVTLTKPVFPLKKYNVAFYRRADGAVVLHRIVGRKNDAYIMAGDAQNFTEYPVYEKDIIAVVSKVVRDGKIIETIENSKSKYVTAHHRRLFFIAIRVKLAAAYRRFIKKK